MEMMIKRGLGPREDMGRDKITALKKQKKQKRTVLTEISLLFSFFLQVISSDGAYALSASWDKTLRLWELATGTTTRRFVGHTNDVLSVSFSADNRQIVSGSRDRTIKLWNTLGDCKFTITDKGHTEWVSCVRFSPNPQNPVIVSSSWDKLVKVRNRPIPLSPFLLREGGETQREILRMLRMMSLQSYKYLLLQSLLCQAMRPLNTIALMMRLDS